MSQFKNIASFEPHNIATCFIFLPLKNNEEIEARDVKMMLWMREFRDNSFRKNEF